MLNINSEASFSRFLLTNWHITLQGRGRWTYVLTVLLLPPPPRNNTFSPQRANKIPLFRVFVYATKGQRTCITLRLRAPLNQGPRLNGEFAVNLFVEIYTKCTDSCCLLLSIIRLSKHLVVFLTIGTLFSKLSRFWKICLRVNFFTVSDTEIDKTKE